MANGYLEGFIPLDNTERTLGVSRVTMTHQKQGGGKATLRISLSTELMRRLNVIKHTNFTIQVDHVNQKIALVFYTEGIPETVDRKFIKRLSVSGMFTSKNTLNQYDVAEGSREDDKLELLFPGKGVNIVIFGYNTRSVKKRSIFGGGK